MSDREAVLQKLEIMVEIQKAMAESLGPSVFPSEQVILKKYEPGDLATFKAEVCYEDGLVTEAETRSLMNHLHQNLLGELGEEASSILNAYAEGASSTEEVADSLDLSVNRVRTVQKNILKYANQWYPWKKFTMAKQFAQFLQDEVLVND